MVIIGNRRVLDFENGVLSIPYFMTFILFQESMKDAERKLDSLSNTLNLNDIL